MAKEKLTHYDKANIVSALIERSSDLFVKHKYAKTKSKKRYYEKREESINRTLNKLSKMIGRGEI